MTTLLIEELSLRAWPAFEEHIYDGWILRFAEGYTKRANSVNLLGPGTIDVSEKIAHCEKIYGEHGLPTVFKLVSGVAPPGIDRALEERGYSRLDETSVRTLSFEGYTPRQEIEHYTRANDAWLTAFARCSGIDNGDKLARILHNIPGETVFAYTEGEGRITACGLGVLDRGYLWCFDIVVDECYRGKGYGRRIMEGLLGEGARRGAGTAYLQVVAGNRPAENLYDSLGFAEIYRYWYRKEMGESFCDKL